MIEDFSNSESSDSKSAEVTEVLSDVLTNFDTGSSNLFADSEPDPPEPFLYDPWREKDTNSNDGKPLRLGFKDCFVEWHKARYLNGKNAATYEPLEDTLEYIEKLKKKLEKYEKREFSEDCKEFAHAIFKAKEESNHAHLNDTKGSFYDDFDDAEEKEMLHKGTVDPQGAAGKVIRKCAPDRVAVDDQELVKLLSMDMLDKESQKLAKIFENCKENVENEERGNEEEEHSEYESADEEHEDVETKDNSELEKIIPNTQHTD